ncbi:MAG: D-alanyl-D-alanine carboxypeptidase [Chlamydiae bacterium]|nr:D-alanyl-D-alanine carboxypeptidase [Chlamydiota bacterium]MBI3277009.1 D-alanyl-D-alanine carboxypeptidase [Chlamydiota bacterium]
MKKIIIHFILLTVTTLALGKHTYQAKRVSHAHPKSEKHVSAHHTKKSSSSYLNERGIPDSSLSSYLVINADTHDILVQKDPNEAHAPASLTKLMTLYLVLEAIQKGKINWEQIYTVSPRISSIGGSRAKLWRGEKISIRDLVKATVIGSANDAAVLLAEIVSGSQNSFVEIMNQRAHQLGLTQTIFRSPHGLPVPKDQPKDTTTASDLARLALALLRDHPNILEYSSVKETTIREGKWRFINTNKLIGKYPGMDGLKTGFTNDAGFCLVATVKKENLRLISVVLGAPTNKERFKYTRQLLDDGFSRYTNIFIPCKGKVFDLSIHHSSQKVDQGIACGNLLFMVPKNKASQVKFSLLVSPSLILPIAQGQKIGEYVATLDQEILAHVNVEAKDEIKKAGVFRRIWGGS